MPFAFVEMSGWGLIARFDIQMMIMSSDIQVMSKRN